jgi:hypothetical protein
LKQQHQQHEVGTSTSTARSWNNNINGTKLEHQHQQHEVGTTTSLATTTRSWSWSNIIGMKLEHQHQWQ